MNRFFRQPAARRWGVWAAAWTLLLAGLLGPLHRAWHPRGDAGATRPATSIGAGGTAPAPVLFAQHDDGDAQCRLLDQALQFHGFSAGTAWLPPVLPQPAPGAAGHAGEGRRTLAAYLARAPPQAG